MAIRIPQNQIQYNYTSGKEYMDVSSYREYQGYYYKLSGKIFAGNEFNSNAPELIPIPKDNINIPNKFNSLLTKASTYTYGRISGAKIKQTKINSIPFNNKDNILRYFIKKIDTHIIKEVDETTFINTQFDPLYQTLSVNFNYALTDKELDELDKKMLGIKIYLQDDIINIQTSSDENIS